MLMYVIALSIGLSIFYYNTVDSFGCTHSIDWIAEDKIIKDPIRSNQRYVVFENSSLKVDSDITFLGREHPMMTLSFTKNKLANTPVTVRDVQLQLLVNGKNVPISTSFTLEACGTTQVCRNESRGALIDVEHEVTDFHRIDIYLDKFHNDEPEMASIKIDLDLTDDGEQFKASKLMALSKYSRRYNCLKGNGHPLRKL